MNEREVFGLVVDEKAVVVPCLLVALICGAAVDRINLKLEAHLNKGMLARMSFWERLFVREELAKEHLLESAAPLLKKRTVISLIGVAAIVAVFIFYLVADPAPGPGRTRWGR